MRRPVTALACGAALLALVASAAPALAAHAAKAAGPFGQGANLTGDWARYFARPGQSVDPKFLPPRPPPPPLKPSYQAAYDKLRQAEKEADAKGQPIGGNSIACLPDGMPQLMFAIYPLEILQTPGKVTIIEEAYAQVRHIYLGKPQVKIEDYAPGYFGHSVGHWEGDALLVDTIGIKESVPAGRDVPHSDQMRIDERLHLVAPDILQDQITITDPKVFTGPWTFTYAYKRLKDYEMLEYVCEDNREYLDPNGGTHLRLLTPGAGGGG